MKNLRTKLGLALLSMTVLACGVSKPYNRYLKSFEPLYLSYTEDSTCYSRSIQIKDDLLYTVNSNGFAYSYNLTDQSSKRMNMLPMPELRDFALHNGFLIATQASEQGSILFLDEGTERAEFLSEDSVFWDAIDLNKKGFGLVVGDPVKGRFQVFTTLNGGETWVPDYIGLEAIAGEAAFAASGSIAQVINDSTFYFVSGGMQSRLFKTRDAGMHWESVAIPFEKKESCGAFSMYFKNERFGICVGGDYTKPKVSSQNCFYTMDGGQTWLIPETSPRGYRSHVIEAQNVLYACGTTGIDFSVDFGKNWTPLYGINTFAMTYYKGYVYATTTKGRVLFFKALQVK